MGATSRQGERGNVLVIDEDDADSRDLLRSVLTKDGYQVDVAENG